MTWRSATYAVWALLGFAALVLTVLSVVWRRRVVAPFGPLRAFLAGHRAARAAAVLGWMWLGWHFFAR